MKCWHCRTELIWDSDSDFEDEGLEGAGIVTHLTCPNCPVTVEVFYTEPKGDSNAKPHTGEAQREQAQNR